LFSSALSECLCGSGGGVGERGRIKDSSMSTMIVYVDGEGL